MAKLQYLLAKTLKQFSGQKIYREAMLIYDWETVVGSELAQGFVPINIHTSTTGRTLRLQTSSSGMATARYIEPMLLERVNRFFGCPYISNIKTTQGVVKKLANKKVVRNMQQEPKTLEDALEALGRHIGGDYN
jgi:hypothetical protein